MTTQNELPAQDAPPEGVVEVVETGSGAFTQTVTAGRHHLIADEPKPIGDDAGPTPYDLLLAALGTCTSMTVRMYATKKRWPLEQVRIRLRHSRIHADDCADCETRIGLIDHIDRQIELVGDLDEAQRERLLSVAERCPVHQTLNAEMHVATSLR